MPNSVKHSETAVDNALGVGNMHIGAGGDKGPTSTTGFYNGINPPSGGYTVYMNKQSGGPSIVCPANDADLITFTENLTGESMTDVNACFAYFAGETDKMVMHNPIAEMVTNGLVLCLNANIIPSYPRSGTSWKDISGKANNGTLTNGPTFNSTGWIELDGTDDEIIISDDSTLDLTTDMSFEFVVKVDSTQNNLYPRLIDKSIYLIHLSQTSPFTIAQNITTQSGLRQTAIGSAFTADTWTHIVCNYDGQYGKIYVNGELVKTSDFSSELPCNTNSSVVTVGGNTGTSRQLNGDIALVKVYNEVLTQAEVLQNYYQGSIVTDNLVFAADAGNLVSYENSETTTYSLTGSYDATLTNGVDFVNSNGGFWDFDGVDDYIEIPYNSYWNTNVFGEAENFTIMCWTKCDNFYNWSSMIHKDNGSGWYSSTEGAALWANAGGFQAVFGSGNSGNPSGWGFVIDYETSNTTDWFHLAFTGDGITGRFYVNGVEHTTAALSSRSATVNTSTNPVRFGVRAGSANYNGKITLPLLYDRGLTAAEVQQNYNSTVNKFN